MLSITNSYSAIFLTFMLVPLVLADETEKPAVPAGEALADTGVQELACKVIEVVNEDCGSLRSAISPLFVKRNERKITSCHGSMLMVRGTEAQIKAIEYLVKRIDVPAPDESTKIAGSERQVRIFVMQHTSAKEILEVIQPLLAPVARSHHRGGVPRFTVHERNNAVVVSGTEKQIRRVSGLVKTLDVPSRPISG
jgi:type II secretory pathway component GspD/PulD (secretin)